MLHAAIATIIVSSNNISNLGAVSLTQALEKSGNLCEFNISHNAVQPWKSSTTLAYNTVQYDRERLLCDRSSVGLC